MSDQEITEEIIQVSLLKEIPKGTYKVLTAPAAAEAIKEYGMKHASKYGLPATIYQLRTMYYFPVHLNGTGEIWKEKPPTSGGGCRASSGGQP